jgi:HlyD family secretion protein
MSTPSVIFDKSIMPAPHKVGYRLMMRQILITVLLTVMTSAICMGLAGCDSKAVKGKKDTSRAVSVSRAVRGEISEDLKTTGDVLSINTVTLRAAVEGPIRYCPWREGDYVEKDQKLIEINRPLYERELEVAKAELAVKKAMLEDLEYGPRPEEIAVAKNELIHSENCEKFAKIDLSRLELLSEKKAVSDQDREKAELNYIKCRSLHEMAKHKLQMLLEGTKATELAVARTAVSKAEANVALAQAKVNECIIVAPFNGIITEVYVRPGDLTHLSSPRMPLLKIMDSESLIVRAGIPERSAMHIGKDSQAMVELDAYPGEKLNAVIERIYPKFEKNSRTRIIELRIIDKRKLLPRMFARITVKGKHFEDAVLIPASAIVTTPRGQHVVFVADGAVAKMKQVSIGLEHDNLVQVISGIKEGQMVITAGNLDIKDGTLIKMNQQPPAQEVVEEIGK